MTKIYRVSEINSYVREVLTSIPLFNNISVRGEIINLKKYARAFYFTLKEADEARISGVIFNIAAFPPTLKDGDEVVVTGRISLHEKSGTYQLIGNDVVYYGLGAKLVALKALYEKLAKTGIFADDKKMPLPRFPKRIGVIAPKDSAALADIISNIERRYPLVTLVIKTAIVQGDLAPNSIKAAYEAINAQAVDLIIIARGGGSSDDLWAFNDENVVLTFAKRTVPLISAIGHEIDTTLIDYLSDARASTPTAAAELAVPHQDDITQTLNSYEARITNSFTNLVANYTHKVSALSSRPVLINYQATLNVINERLDTLGAKLTNLIVHKLKDVENFLSMGISHFAAFSQKIITTPKEELVSLHAKLETLNPQQVLKRGFAFVTRNGNVINMAQSLQTNDIIKIQFSDGNVIAKVEEEDEQ